MGSFSLISDLMIPPINATPRDLKGPFHSPSLRVLALPCILLILSLTLESGWAQLAPVRVVNATGIEGGLQATFEHSSFKLSRSVLERAANPNLPQEELEEDMLLQSGESGARRLVHSSRSKILLKHQHPNCRIPVLESVAVDPAKESIIVVTAEKTTSAKGETIYRLQTKVMSAPRNPKPGEGQVYALSLSKVSPKLQIELNKTKFTLNLNSLRVINARKMSYIYTKVLGEHEKSTGVMEDYETVPFPNLRHLFLVVIDDAAGVPTIYLFP